MTRGRKYPESPGSGSALFMQRLFEKMADSAAGGLTLERWTAEDAYVLRLDEPGWSPVLRRVRVCPNEGGLPLVSVGRPSSKDGILVEARASAVLAIMRHC